MEGDAGGAGGYGGEEAAQVYPVERQRRAAVDRCSRGRRSETAVRVNDDAGAATPSPTLHGRARQPERRRLRKLQENETTTANGEQFDITAPADAQDIAILHQRSLRL